MVKLRGISIWYFSFNNIDRIKFYKLIISKAMISINF